MEEKISNPGRSVFLLSAAVAVLIALAIGAISWYMENTIDEIYDKTSEKRKAIWAESREIKKQLKKVERKLRYSHSSTVVVTQQTPPYTSILPSLAAANADFPIHIEELSISGTEVHCSVRLSGAILIASTTQARYVLAEYMDKIKEKTQAGYSCVVNLQPLWHKSSNDRQPFNGKILFSRK